MRDQIIGEIAHFEERLALADEFRDASLKLHSNTGRFVDYGSMPGVREDELRRISAMYSLGAPISDIRGAFDNLPEWFSRELWHSPTSVDDPSTLGSSFNDFLWVAALTVLLDDAEGAAWLAEAVLRTGMTDFLVDSFLGSLIDFREPSQMLQMEIISNFHGVEPVTRSHEPLKAVAELAATDPGGSAAAFTKYVEKDWYQLHSWTGWHNKHKSRRGSENYSGYWCFEGAAVAKVFGVDDSSLEISKYYPWDLAHP